MLVRVALGRQIKERQGWVDQAEPRRFLVSFDVESDSYAAAAASALRPSRRFPRSSRARAHLRKSERPTKRATSSWELTTSRSSGTRRTETHAHACYAADR